MPTLLANIAAALVVLASVATATVTNATAPGNAEITLLIVPINTLHA